jgi:cytochrome P450
VVARILAGEELSRDEKFIHLSMKFGDSVIMIGIMIALLPLGPFRRFFGWLISQFHRWILYRVMRMVEPTVNRRKAEAPDRKSVPRYDDSIGWAIKLDDPPERDNRTVSLEMLHILEAAAGAPGAMISELLYQLLVEPQYFAILEEETKTAIASSQDLNKTLQKLPLMNSFIMETNRMYPVGGGMSYFNGLQFSC